MLPLPQRATATLKVTVAVVALSLMGVTPAVSATSSTGASSAATQTPEAIPSQIEVGGVSGFSSSPSPTFPSSFSWSQRAKDFDNFVYDWTDRGAFSTILKDTTAYNMPAGSTTYKMPAYYGDTRVQNLGDNNGDGYQEAVTQFSSVISATLVGVNKAAQPCNEPGGNGTCNYVDMLQTYFHTDTGVAGNTPLLGKAGDGKNIPGTLDGWYQVLPNILYYMIGEQYPEASNMATIQRSIADNFYDMVVQIGGANANFTMQDYDFAAGQKYVTSRDEAAEIATASTAVLLWANEKFGDAKYLDGARWSMDAMDRATTNTYYEMIPVMLPYLAARMNAQFGTDYDVAKYFRWLMRDSASRGGWGTIGSNVSGAATQWGGTDVSGLSGSLSDSGFDGNSGTNGYAFAMNSFSTTWLAATAKYDTRYANTVGKWMLNLNNASRLYFADQVTPSQQYYGSDYTDGVSTGVAGSSTGWATDDRARAIAYEGLQPHASKGILAASDVPTRSSSWGTGSDARGLGLYGSGWIGFMSIIHPTNVANVLRTDLNALDSYGANTFPTSLIYNPTSSDAAVDVTVASGSKDLYDSITGTYLARGVSGTVQVTVAKGSSVVVVEVPAGATLATTGSTTTANGEPIAYDTNTQRDLALGATAQATVGASAAVPATALTDGQDATTWISSSSGARVATIDLGTDRTIGSVAVNWGVTFPATYSIETSTDGTTWSTAATVAASHGGKERTTFAGKTAHFIRVSIPVPAGGTSATYALRGVEAYDADLALGALTKVSGSANSLNAPSGMTDGSMATRWESPSQDAVWAYVDLGAVKPLGSVELVWETAASKAYQVSVSDDASTWSAAVATVTNGTPGETRTLTLPAGTSGRYVRIDTTLRATTYANSLYRFSVYGSTGTSSTANAPEATTTTLTLTPTTQYVGASGSERAVANVQVTSETGELPDGTVQLLDGTTVVGSAPLAHDVPSGAAAAQVRVSGALAVGVHSLHAIFIPADANSWATSSSAAAQLTVKAKPVVKAQVSLSLSAAKSSLQVGRKPIVTVAARASDGWMGGQVTVTTDGQKPVVVTVPASGSATITLAPLKTAKSITLRADYAGSATYTPAAATSRNSVAKAKTTTKASLKKKVRRGTKVTVKVKVTGAVGVGLQGRATVRLKGLTSKKTTVKTIRVNSKGIATLKVRAQRTGRVTVKVTYVGNSNQAKSVAKTVTTKVRR